MNKNIVLIGGGCASMTERVKIIINEMANEQVKIVNNFSQPEPMYLTNIRVPDLSFFNPIMSRKERRKQERQLKKC